MKSLMVEDNKCNETIEVMTNVNLGYETNVQRGELVKGVGKTCGGSASKNANNFDTHLNIVEVRSNRLNDAPCWKPFEIIFCLHKSEYWDCITHHLILMIMFI
jgi:hypothetical protein